MGLRVVLGASSVSEGAVMHAWGELSQRVLQLLAEVGPLSRADICRHLQRSKYEISSVVTRLNRRGARAGKRIYVLHYVHEMEGEKRHPRAIYALGDKEDAPRPGADNKGTKQRYWAGVMQILGDQICATLAEHGPQTLTELEAEIPKVTRWTLSAALKILRSADDPAKRRVFICDYIDDPSYHHRAPRYALGDQPDKKRPPLSKAHRSRRDKGLVMRKKTNSVFNLGVSIPRKRKKASDVCAGN